MLTLMMITHWCSTGTVVTILLIFAGTKYKQAISKDEMLIVRNEKAKLLQFFLKNLVSEIILFQQHSAQILGDSVVLNIQHSYETPDRLRSTNLPLWKYLDKDHYLCANWHYLCVNYARGLLCSLALAKLPWVLSISEYLSTFSPSLFCGQLEVSIDAALLHKPLEPLTVLCIQLFHDVKWSSKLDKTFAEVLWEPT